MIVGAGLAGLYAIHVLRGRGMTVRCFEAGADVGGTWFWNRYPGARCDVESVDYSYSFSEELQQEWTWTERYAPQPEILRYIEHVAERFDLRREIDFETRVTSADFEAEEARWTVVTDRGEEVSARFCVMATGCLSTPRLPEVTGIDLFEGEILHPGTWPADLTAADLRGRRVALIGTGSSGIQLAPALAPEVERLYVLQRTANFSMPAHNHPLSEEAVRRVKESYPQRRRESRLSKRGFPLPAAAGLESALDFSPGERRRRLERMWANGGAIFTSVFADVVTEPRSNEIVSEFVREQIREIVEDPETAELLCPYDHGIGGKRPCVDSDFYATFNRDNVRLIDVRTDPIVEFTRRGLRTVDQDLELDTVVFATGYDAITGSLNAIDIRGRDGELLREKWELGTSALLGLCTAGFPNMFLITGPGSPSVLCNMTVSIEQHTELMLALIERAEAAGAELIEADAGAEAEWADHVAQIAAQTILVEANSWYMGANIPGKPRMFMPYAAGMAQFEVDCQEIADRDWEGFRFSSREAAPAVG